MGDANYYETYYTEYLKTQPYNFVGNPWLEFAKWLLHKKGEGTIEQPTEEGVRIWNAFYSQQCEKIKGPMDILLVRANDAVQRRSLQEPEMPLNEQYESYKESMLKRLREATIHKKQLAVCYKGLLLEENIITMDNSDILTQREWEDLEAKKEARRIWLRDNKDRFVQEAFEELDKHIVERRKKHESMVTDATTLASTWVLPIPESKKDKEALLKKLKSEWRFKDAISGLKHDTPTYTVRNPNRKA